MSVYIKTILPGDDDWPKDIDGALNRVVYYSTDTIHKIEIWYRPDSKNCAIFGPNWIGEDGEGWMLNSPTLYYLTPDSEEALQLVEEIASAYWMGRSHGIAEGEKTAKSKIRSALGI